jgi:hypothetical protein
VPPEDEQRLAAAVRQLQPPRRHVAGRETHPSRAARCMHLHAKGRGFVGVLLSMACTFTVYVHKCYLNGKCASVDRTRTYICVYIYVYIYISVCVCV